MEFELEALEAPTKSVEENDGDSDPSPTPTEKVPSRIEQVKSLHGEEPSGTGEVHGLMDVPEIRDIYVRAVMRGSGAATEAVKHVLEHGELDPEYDAGAGRFEGYSPQDLERVAGALENAGALEEDEGSYTPAEIEVVIDNPYIEFTGYLDG